MTPAAEKAKHKLLCPVCKGSGYFELPISVQKSDTAVKEYLVKHLLKKGYGVRQIQRAVGYKSSRSAHLIIKKIKKL